MGFADSFGEYLCFSFILVWVFALMAAKLLRVVDDDGEVQKTANNGLAAWIEELFKSK